VYLDCAKFCDAEFDIGIIKFKVLFLHISMYARKERKEKWMYFNLKKKLSPRKSKYVCRLFKNFIFTAQETFFASHRIMSRKRLAISVVAAEINIRTKCRANFTVIADGSKSI